MNDFRGWISPDGERYETASGEDHGNHADRLLSQFYPNWKWADCKRFTECDTSYPSMALEFKGWVRVVCICSYSAWRLDGNTKSTILELVAQENGRQRLHLDIYTGNHRFETVQDFLEVA